MTWLLCLAAQERDAQELAAYVDKARATPKGQKKDYSGDMPKAYDPKFVEAGTYVSLTVLCSMQWCQPRWTTRDPVYLCCWPAAEV